MSVTQQEVVTFTSRVFDDLLMMTETIFGGKKKI